MHHTIDKLTGPIIVACQWNTEGETMEDGFITVYAWTSRTLEPLISHSYMWQSRIEIKYYSLTYLKRITDFDVL